jgi:pullulanase-type alpha-1,6-glucosidase
MENYRTAIAAGAKVVFGSDTAVIPHGDNAKQFSVYVDLGMSPMEAIQSATTLAAESLGLVGDTGAVAPGYFADVIAVEGDPLEDVSVLENVVFVLKGGRVYKSRSGCLPPTRRAQPVTRASRLGHRVLGRIAIHRCSARPWGWRRTRDAGRSVCSCLEKWHGQAKAWLRKATGPRTPPDRRAAEGRSAGATGADTVGERETPNLKGDARLVLRVECRAGSRNGGPMSAHVRFLSSRSSSRSALLVAALALLAGWLAAGLPAAASHTPDPSTVTVAGSLQEELGCPGDWQPDCADTHLGYDAEDDVWQGIFNVPAGMWEYKAPLNDSWDENYGANAVPGGANIPLDLGADTDVKFYYDHETHWITDNVNSVIATAPGNFQSELGCSGDWQPWCLQSWLQDPDGDGTFVFETSRLPAGGYEVKVAHDESWTENYGAGGVQNGPNIPFTVPGDCADMSFEYELSSHLLTVSEAPAPAQPASVAIPGSFQEELGCPGDWQPDCAVTDLAFDAEDRVWQGTFDIPAGSWEYKAALNDSWDVNYGANATQNGPNIGLSLGSPAAVKFYYSDSTHWVTDNQNATIATLAGNLQSELGCPGDWQPWCLRSWLQDPDGDGIYTFSTAKLPAGNYEVKIAHDESWDENYGAGGVPGGANIPFTVPASCTEIFFTYDPVTHLLDIGTAPGGPVGNLGLAQAHWVTEDTVAWSLGALPGDAAFALHYSATGALTLDETGVINGDGALALTLDPAGLPAAVTEKFPHLAGYDAFKLAPGDLSLVPAILKGQFAVSAAAGDGTPIDATALQIPGVLDELYAYDGDLGVVWMGGAPSLVLWAPTAQSVTLHLYDDSDPATTSTTVPMTEDAVIGVWSAPGDGSWAGKYYLYEVTVWAPTTGQIEANLVTDPYSLSLSADSARSQIVDLTDAALAPADWDSLEKPPLAAPEDVSIYELHVRDFSWVDPSVSETERGTLRAFTDMDSFGMEHLAALAEAGLSHVHLLPSFDVATIPEVRADQVELDFDQLATYPPDSDQQQAAVATVEDDDGFNWGYDPWHYAVPEGSYATDPDGSQRIIEFREMVQSLNQTGLRVVMDVVYNHTHSAGQSDKSVLDKIVPGYYHRLNGDGGVETSSCCPNTATEHTMMEKLMVDSLMTWARDYKVDGFRFDLMGHHPKSTMLKIRAAMDAMTEADDGVDGSQIYLYGEGWNFGEVANNARFEQATQANMAGTGIGSFNDRIRDGARGGGPFSGLQEQGFVTGLFYDPNATNQGSPADQADRLRLEADWIRVSLAGNLRNYPLIDRFGNPIVGSELDYNGQPAGYTLDPQEIINYVSAHDNETLFDAVQLKVPLGTSMSERVRVHNLGLDLVALGQGVPFFQAGTDMLRSKSLDRDSFNSGDWFNRLDFTYQANNWGVGLPVASKNQSNWPLFGPLLANPALQAGPADIEAAVGHLREMLAIRKSSRLFRLTTEAEVIARLDFLNTGPAQVPGLIVMSLSDPDGSVDRVRASIVVLFNATDDPQDLVVPALAGVEFGLHEVQQASADPVVATSSFDTLGGTFSTPPRTTAVFVAMRPASEQIDLLVADVESLVLAGALSPGRGRALIAKLESARRSVERGEDGRAAHHSSVFIHQVDVFERVGILGAEEATALRGAARDLIRSLA